MILPIVITLPFIVHNHYYIYLTLECATTTLIFCQVGGTLFEESRSLLNGILGRWGEDPHIYFLTINLFTDMCVHRHISIVVVSVFGFPSLSGFVGSHLFTYLFNTWQEGYFIISRHFSLLQDYVRCCTYSEFVFDLPVLFSWIYDLDLSEKWVIY